MTQISCIALMAIKRKVLIPTYHGKKVKLNRTFASQVIAVLRCLHTENRRKIFLLSILDVCGHVYTLKKCNFILVLIKLVSGQIGKIWPS